jgi:hypothetical protein
MRAIQLKCYYTQKPAPEADRIRIQARIDELRKKVEEAYAKGDLIMIGSYEHSIACLKGERRMPRG